MVDLLRAYSKRSDLVFDLVSAVEQLWAGWLAVEFEVCGSGGVDGALPP
jgi:hypothetical protein